MLSNYPMHLAFSVLRNQYLSKRIEAHFCPGTRLCEGPFNMRGTYEKCRDI
jgi:hypothetical protein